MSLALKAHAVGCAVCLFVSLCVLDGAPTEQRNSTDWFVFVKYAQCVYCEIRSVHLGDTVMRRLTTGISSEKCVFR